MKVTNVPEANQYVQHSYRTGWSLDVRLRRVGCDVPVLSAMTSRAAWSIGRPGVAQRAESTARAISATSAASRTRRWRPCTRSTRCTPTRQYAAQAAQATFDLVDRLERELSRFLPNSDITRINHLAAGESTRVGAVDARVPRDRAAHVRSHRRRVRRVDRHGAAVARARRRRVRSSARRRAACRSISAASARATRSI